MMKTSRNSVIVWLCASIAIMFLLPFGVARFASECAGMALCMLLFFCGQSGLFHCARVEMWTRFQAYVVYASCVVGRVSGRLVGGF